MGNRIFTIMIFTGISTLFFLCSPAWAQKTEVQADYLLSHISRAEGDRMYALTEKSGALVSLDRGNSWETINRGLPIKQVWPFDEDEYRRFTSLTVDSNDSRRLAATTSTSLFLSDNGGQAWVEADLRYPVKASNYLTAVSFDPGHPRRIYLGSSFNGLFVSEDRGQTWEKVSEHLDPLYRGAGFYEEITDLAMVPGREDELFIAVSFDNLIYRYDTVDKVLMEIELPEGAEILNSINSYNGGYTDAPALEVHFANGRYIFDLTKKDWRSVPSLLRRETGRLSVQDTDMEAEYDNIRAIYLNAYNARGEVLQEHLEFLREHGFNAIVVDVKDDWGRLTYDSQLDLPAQIDAVHPVFDLEELIREAHTAGMYVIGRMVVFKDKRVYQMDNHAHAVWNKQTDGPWRYTVPEEREEDGETKTVYVQREFWTDPFSEFVWDYNIGIARELEARGIDEIQFDYIRFPSDGNVEQASYRHRKPDMIKTEAIESFIKKARSQLDLPISTDLYGFNSWYRMGNWIGQDIGMLSHYVDVICPMYYPSHFPHNFMVRENYIDRAFELYRKGTERARRIAGPGSHIRPYVQAFLIGRELSMEEEEYQLYLNRQLEGVFDAGGCGYTLWNNTNRYYMVNGQVIKLNSEAVESCTHAEKKVQKL